jgi:hypothetical protein
MEILLNVATLLVGGGLFAFLQFLINRHDSKHDKSEAIVKAISEISEKVGKLEASIEKRDALQSRTHILRFRDELDNDIKHSGEYFLQVLDDIETYEKYCNANPDFANGRTKASSKIIRDEYERLSKEHKLA